MASILQVIFKYIYCFVSLTKGKGIPDVNVRLMIRKIRDNLKIPVFGLMDADPYGMFVQFSLILEPQQLTVYTLGLDPLFHNNK